MTIIPILFVTGALTNLIFCMKVDYELETKNLTKAHRKALQSRYRFHYVGMLWDTAAFTLAWSVLL